MHHLVFKSIKLQINSTRDVCIDLSTDTIDIKVSFNISRTNWYIWYFHFSSILSEKYWKLLTELMWVQCFYECQFIQSSSALIMTPVTSHYPEKASKVAAKGGIRTEFETHIFKSQQQVLMHLFKCDHKQRRFHRIETHFFGRKWMNHHLSEQDRKKIHKLQYLNL